jgi:hypothetical protein
LEPTIDLSYKGVVELITRFAIPGRTESKAFLMWFLESYFHLEEDLVEDTICDGKYDMGIDGIYVDHNLSEINVFQCKLSQNDARTLGDTALKEFVGSLAQFQDAAHVSALIGATTNPDLKALLESLKVADLLQQSYTVRGVFLTNAQRDVNAINYLQNRKNLTVFDRTELENQFVSLAQTGPVEDNASFDIFEADVSEHTVNNQVKILFAALRASELVKLKGIENQDLFSWNVRRSLGRTKVNKDIEASIKNQKEHSFFLLYHNGLTMLCKSFETKENKLIVSDYTVVNGCQSLTSLYDNREFLSDNIRLLVRVIQIPPQDDLAFKITHHSNNQNGITARDLQSNNVIQSRIQADFQKSYSNVFYAVKRGDTTDREFTIDNELAGRILLAFDLKEPWSCHQTYRLFDDSHGQIFGRPEVTAHRIFALHELFEIAKESLEKLSNSLMARYSLTKYFFIYLVREALEGDETGRRFCQNPEKFMSTAEDMRKLKKCLGSVCMDLVIDLEAEVKSREADGNPVDYKRELKSPTAARTLAKGIMPQYRKAVERKRVSSFTEEWNNQTAVLSQ